MLLEHATEPRQPFACAPGKNSTDILMIIDAMDLLHKGEANAFCSVTSDSDFAPLIRRMRNEGLEVYGFGSPSSLASFRRTCSRFFFVENLEPGVPANNTNSRKKPLRPAADAVPYIESGHAWAGVSRRLDFARRARRETRAGEQRVRRANVRLPEAQGPPQRAAWFCR